MVELSKPIFALGGKGAYSYSSPTFWVRAHVPAELENLAQQDRIAEITTASFGEDPEREYFFGIIEKATTETITLCYSSLLPGALLEYVQSSPRGRDFRVVLGPSGSFFAWDNSSMRWAGLPASLEATIQSWLTPTGWKYGPPRIVALGHGGSYFVKSTSGLAVHALTDLRLQQFIQQIAEQTILGSIEAVFLNPTFRDSYVLVTSTTNIICNFLDDLEGFRKVVCSYASEEVQALLAQHWVLLQNEELARQEAKQRAEQQERARRAQEQQEAEQQERARRAQEQQRAEQQERARRVQEQQAREQNDLQRLYKEWKKESTAIWEDPRPWTKFADPPIKACTCQIAHCLKGRFGRGMAACEHDIERLIKASEDYSLEWLKKERKPWHSDKIRPRSSPEWKDSFVGRADLIFSVFNNLIEKARASA